jgi:hypothetical protein
MVLNPLGKAERILKRELRQRGLDGILVSREAPSWLKIYLAEEARTLWIGHAEEEGYFISWDRSSPAQGFFDLDDEGIQDLVALLPAHSAQVREPAERMGRALVDEMRAEAPDVEAVSGILDESRASDAGLDVLSTVAALKRFR